MTLNNNENNLVFRGDKVRHDEAKGIRSLDAYNATKKVGLSEI